MHLSHRGAARHPATGQSFPEGPGELTPCPQTSSLQRSQPTLSTFSTFYLDSFIPGSVGTAKPAPEVTESHIRARDGELKAAHCYFIL